MTALRRMAVGFQATAAVLALAACGPADRADDAAVASGSTSATTSPAAGSPAGTPPSPVPTRTRPENAMQIAITVGDQRFQARLTDSAASRDLIDQLPVTVQMTDHGGVEKTGRLPKPLSLAGQPAGADPDIGDVGYYAPGQDLVLYYGDQSYYDGIVVIGKMAEDAADRLGGIDGAITATVAAVGD